MFSSLPLLRTKFFKNMITKRFFFALALLLSLMATSLNAQEYRTAIGARLGFPFSASFKHFISDPGAVELFAGFRGWTYYRWFNVGGMYQHHMPIESVAGLKWYVGGGASIYFWSYDDVWLGSSQYSSTTFGVMGVVGLDYKFADIPLNLSVDWVPTFFIGDGYVSGFGGGYGALSARYTLR